MRFGETSGKIKSQGESEEAQALQALLATYAMKSAT
jgi:hypothetical protein